MKKLLVAYLLFITIPQMWAQNKEECLQNLSIFAESAKVKNYETAYTPWKAVRDSCPDLNVAIYSYGEKILKDRIKKAADADKGAIAEDLIGLYDQWVQFFPTRKGKSKKGDILSKKAQAMLDYKTADLQTAYNTFENAYQTDAKSFTNPKMLYNYFNSLYKLYKSNADGVTMELLFEKYEEISEKFELEQTNLAKRIDKILKKEEAGDPISSRELRNKKAFETNSKAFGVFASNLDAIIAKEATCENLIPLYERNFEANKGDAVWLKRAASRMDSKDCSDAPLFVTLVEALHQLDPSADSAYYLGLLKDKSGDENGALQYYEESIALETDNYKKAKILFKIATKFKNKGRKSKARSYARKALSFQPSMGRAYLLIANLYASSANDCGQTQFEKRAMYWLAAQMAEKAARVDASIKKVALKTAKSYTGRAPSKTDIFTEGNEGQVIKFNCWVGESITVPKL